MKAFLRFLNDVFELYIPVLSFFIMFTAFLLQVFFRYVVRQPLTWTQEVIVMSFVWTVIFGACHAMKRRSHVKFTMVYDRLKPKPAAFLRLLGNLLVVATFSLLVHPSLKYAFFLGFQKTAVFRISFTVMFISFVYFLCSIIVYSAVDIVEDVRVLLGAISDSRDHDVDMGVPR